ncbi:hypothetical protein PssvBMR18_gp56 [Pseudomonas phage MR18]|nr:hypothetical protein PssvBMR18_gp56 [Pseudomonas phage MR18]
MAAGLWLGVSSSPHTFFVTGGTSGLAYLFRLAVCLRRHTFLPIASSVLCLS